MNNLKTLLFTTKQKFTEAADKILRDRDISYRSADPSRQLNLKELILEYLPDLIFSDGSLPEDITIELIGLSKQIRSECVFIVIGKKRDEKTESRILEAGADDYINTCREARIKNTLKRIKQQKDSENELARARKELKTKEKTDQFALITDSILDSIHNSKSLDEIIEQTTQSIKNNIPSAQQIGIYIVEGNIAVLKSQKGFPSWFVENIGRIPKPRGFVWQTIIQKRTVYCPDTEIDTFIGPAGRKMGIKSYVGIPLTYRSEAIGMMGIVSFKKNSFRTEDINFFTLIGKQLDIAFSNAMRMEELKKSEDRHRLVAEVTNDTLWDLDLESSNIIWSNNIEQLYGYRFNSDAKYDFEWWQKNLQPADRERVLSKLEESIQNKDTYWSDEYRFRCEDGSYRYVFDRGKILYDDKGVAVRMIGSIMDITEKKKAEEKVLQQARLLDVANDAIIVRDVQNRIRYWNMSAEKIYGWSADDVIGKKTTDLFQQNNNSFYEALKNALKQGSWNGEFEHKTQYGKKIVESRWTVVTDPEEDSVLILEVNTDITEKKNIEKQLLRSQRLESIGTLAGGIAHDLNNMLNPVSVSIQMLRDKLKDKNSIKLIDMLEQSTGRAKNLVQQVLAFGRGSESEYRKTDVKHIVAEVEKVLKQTFPKSINIRTSVADDLDNIKCDPNLIHQVVINMCLNAKDAMPAGGTLKLGCRHVTNREIEDHKLNSSHIVITVSDTGTGMDPDKTEKIFEPFYTTKDPGKGTGLGLSTAYKIVNEHGGFIDVGTAPGKGSSFSIFLPSYKESGINEDEENPLIREMPAGQSYCLLVIDDEELILDTTRIILENYGYKVFTASNGMDGVSVYEARKDEIDAVIVDMSMPRMDGPATISALRSVKRNVKILAVSGIAEYKKNYSDIFQAFLSKPFTTDELISCIGTLIGISGK